MDTIDVSLLAAYPGEYREELIAELYSALQLETEGITVIPDVKTDLTLTKLLIKDGLKPYTGDFVGKRDLGYEPRILSVKKAQRDILVHPEEFRPTFMQMKRGKGENSANLNIPYAEFMWRQYMRRIGTEVNLNTVYHGQGTAAFAAYDAGTAYAVGDLIKYTQASELRYFECVIATAAGQNPDTHAAKWKWGGAKAVTKGFGKIFQEAIDAEELTEIATGPADGTNAYGKHMQVYRAHDESVKLGGSGQVLILNSMTDYEYLMDDYENRVSRNFETINGITYLAKTEKRCGIKPVSWLGGSRRIISTVDGNLVAGTDQLNDMNVITTVPKHYKIEASTSFLFGVNFQDPDVLKINDQK